MLNFDRSTVKHALQNTQNDCHQWLSHRLLECTKFVFGRGCRWGELTALPRLPSWFKGTLLLRGRGVEERGGEKRGREGNGGKRKGGNGREGEGRRERREGERRIRGCPLTEIPGSAPDCSSWHYLQRGARSIVNKCSERQSRTFEICQSVAKHELPRSPMRQWWCASAEWGLNRLESTCTHRSWKEEMRIGVVGSGAATRYQKSIRRFQPLTDLAVATYAVFVGIVALKRFFL